LVLSAEFDNSFIEAAKVQKSPVELEIYFPFADDPVILQSSVRSYASTTPRGTTVGLSFEYDYPAIQQYMDSLRLESISNFFT